MSKREFELIVIGGGPAGYNAAIRGAQAGMKTLCAEMSDLGGTCLNVGCIPSKAMLESSAKYEFLSKGYCEEFGVYAQGASFDLGKVLSSKEAIVSKLVGGIGSLFKSNGVEHLRGRAKFIDPHTIAVETESGTKNLTADNFLIATGSYVTKFPGVEFDGDVIISSTEALELRGVPESLVVVGGGVIGLELGSVWSRFGARVTVVEYGERIAPTMDIAVSTELQKLLSKQGLSFETGARVTSIERFEGGAKVRFERAGETHEISGSKVLISIGRKPNSANLGLEDIGVEVDERGYVKNNEMLQTNLPHIYAVGDVTHGPMLAHKAEEEGLMAIMFMRGEKPIINHNIIPAVIYTHPEAASIGKTEQQLKESGTEYKVGMFKFTANGRAMTMRETAGFVKILGDPKGLDIFGVHIVHAHAGSLINECSVLMACCAGPQDLNLIIHSHPDLNEAILAAARDLLGCPVASLPPKKVV